MYKKHLLAFVLLLVLSILASACQSQPAVQTVVVTQVVRETQQVVVTQEVTVEKEVMVTPTPAPMGEADTIRIGGVGPLSAPGAVVGGIAMQFAMNLAVQDIPCFTQIIIMPSLVEFKSDQLGPEATFFHQKTVGHVRMISEMI